MTFPICIRLLGVLEVQFRGKALILPTRKAVLLFAYLVLHRHRPQDRSHLAALLWPDLPEPRARRNLNTEIWRIRQAFGEAAGMLATSPAAVAFDPREPFFLDIAPLDPLPANPTRAELEAAAGAYRGDLLAGNYEDWVLTAQERLRAACLKALTLLLEAALERDDPTAAAAHAQRIIEIEPLSESAHRRLIEIRLRQGDRAAAMAAYRRCVAILRRELGIPPMPETQALYQELLRSFPRGIPEVFVGRRDELAALAAFLRETAALLFITGESGVGKSALIDAWLAEGESGYMFLTTLCRPAGEASYYRPVADALRILANRIGDAFFTGVNETFRRALAQLLSGSQDGPAAPDTLPAHQPAQAREQLFSAVQAVIANLRQPVVLILDDFHNAQPDTLDLLAHLLQRLPSEAFRLVGVFQRAVPALDPDHPLNAWPGPAAASRVLRLGPLGLSETGALLKELSGADEPPVGLSERLYFETEGNPLFIMETVRDLFDSGTLIRDTNGRWALLLDGLRAGETLPVSAGIESVIRSRLSRLSRDARSFLAVASVLGTSFDYGLLLESAQQTDERTLDALETALRASILRDLGDGERFAFRHEKLRILLYKDIPALTRAELHERVARALCGRTDGGQDAEAIAHHYLHGSRPAAALPYLVQAAERAEQLYAFQAALDFLDQAIGLGADFEAADPEIRFAVQLKRVEYLRLTGRMQPALALSGALRSQAAALGSPEAAGLALVRAELLIACGSWSETPAVLDEAELNARRAGLARLEAQSLLLRAVLDYHTRQVDAMNAHLEKALDLAKGIGDEDLSYRIELERAANQGLPALRAGGLVRGFETAKRKGRFMDFNQYATTLVINLTYEGRFGLALDYGAELLALAEGCGLETLRHSLWRVLARCHYETGSFEQARDLARSSLNMCRISGYRYGELRALTCLSAAEAGLGDFEHALPRFDRAAALSREIGAATEWFLVMFLAVEAWLRHPDRGVLPGVAVMANEALAEAEAVGYRRAQLLAHMQLAEIHHRQTTAGPAVQHARRASALLEAHGHAIGREHQVLHVLARSLRCAGEGDWEPPAAEARRLLAKRAQSLQDHGARQMYLTRFDLHREIRAFHRT